MKVRHLSAEHEKAIELLKAGGGELYYQPSLYGFALSGTDAWFSGRISRDTAKELELAGVIKQVSTKACTRPDTIDLIVLVNVE